MNKKLKLLNLSLLPLILFSCGGNSEKDLEKLEQAGEQASYPQYDFICEQQTIYGAFEEEKNYIYWYYYDLNYQFFYKTDNVYSLGSKILFEVYQPTEEDRLYLYVSFPYKLSDLVNLINTEFTSDDYSSFEFKSTFNTNTIDVSMSYTIEVMGVNLEESYTFNKDDGYLTYHKLTQTGVVANRPYSSTSEITYKYYTKENLGFEPRIINKK